ncbi:MAG: nicotinate-nucleotide diphosphorylase (carboxylating), partial [Verrucomicrobia bacterium]|nr:nicotinate-nucleotide diphosphorylase (carboxylating) [Verrucomicrobiota bacterium]
MNLTQLDPQQVQQAVRAALAEDVGTGDATTLALVPAELQSKAVMAARESLTVCGLAFAVEAYRQLDPTV